MVAALSHAQAEEEEDGNPGYQRQSERRGWQADPVVQEHRLG